MHVSIAPHGEVAGSAVGGPPTTGMAGQSDSPFEVDRVRATLMLLGIALHAADVFVSSGDWLVADPRRGVAFDALVVLIHSFRIPGFFLLSGLLFAGSLSRHAGPDLLVRQLLRLGLPLLTGWTLLNGAQAALLAWHRQEDPWAAMMSMSTPVAHLWFLRDLLVLNLAVLAGHMLAAPLRRATPTRRMAGGADAAFAGWSGGLAGLAGSPGTTGPTASAPPHWLTVALTGALLGLGLSLVTRLSGLAHASLPGGMTLFNLSFYAPMFLAGLAMSHRPVWRDAWLRTPLWLLPIGAFAASWGDAASRTLPNPVAREAALAVQLLGIWIATGAAVGALGRWRFPSGPGRRIGRALADASYTIFLVHHLLVVAFALLLLPLDWPAALKFTLIAAGTLVFSLAFHRWVVRPFAAMRLLFNGRLPAASPEPPAHAAPRRA